MIATTETTLDALTLARNMRQLHAEEKGRRRRMAIRRRPARRGRLGSALWWVWPTSWATVFGAFYFTADVWRDTLNIVLVSAGY